MPLLNTNNPSSVSFLPYMPFDPAWIEQSEAFFHEDPRMAKGALRLLFAAWRGSPVGSIPASIPFISSATGLPQEFVTEHFELLTDGFDCSENNRLQHIALTKLCVRITEQYGPEIEALSLTTALASQSDNGFKLANKRGKSKRGMSVETLIPEDFGYDMGPKQSNLRNWCNENNYQGEYKQKWIMERFIDYAINKPTKQKDWVATFRTFARNQFEWGRLPPPEPVANNGVLPDAFSVLARQPMTKGDRITRQNLDMLNHTDQRDSGNVFAASYPR